MAASRALVLFPPHSCPFSPAQVSPHPITVQVSRGQGELCSRIYRYRYARCNTLRVRLRQGIRSDSRVFHSLFCNSLFGLFPSLSLSHSSTVPASSPVAAHTSDMPRCVQHLPTKTHISIFRFIRLDTPLLFDHSIPQIITNISIKVHILGYSSDFIMILRK